MRDVLWPGTILGYCTNVHAGATLEEVKANLEKHALAVKQQVCPNEPMGIGLWLAADVARELIEQQRIDELRDWLGERGLEVFTMNGFPYGNFHEPVVKHKVYEPNWRTRDRFDYTINLAIILAQLLGERTEGSISTLPLGWGAIHKREMSGVVDALSGLAGSCNGINSRFGKLIHLDIEPEPGCALSDLGTTAAWFRDHLFVGIDEALMQRHLRVCLDTCHAAVMHDDMAASLREFDDLGIAIGKVQISNAPRLDLRNHSAQERATAIAQLQSFAEDRYLHQTTIGDGEAIHFHDDLPDALLRYHETDRAGDEWRIHYHVPIYLESFGLIGTTQSSIIDCLRLLRDRDVSHWEIETYAWNVLPQELQHDKLADGIAAEFRWLIDQAEKQQ